MPIRFQQLWLPMHHLAFNFFLLYTPDAIAHVESSFRMLKGYLIFLAFHPRHFSLSLQRLHLTPSPHPPRLATHLALLLLLPLPLLINLRGERILKPQRNLIHHQNQRTQHQPRRFPKPQRRPHKTHRTPIIHGTPTDIEGKPRDNLIHQNPEIISQICSRDPQSPHTRQYENIAARDEAHGEGLR